MIDSEFAFDPHTTIFFMLLCQTGACILGFLLDLIIGDPQWFKAHPIRLVGNLIGALDRALRKKEGSTKTRDRWAGMALALIVIVATVGVPAVILYFCMKVHFLLALAVDAVFCYFIFATKALKTESMRVYSELEKDDLEGARYAVSMIVGRDTNVLDREGVAKAAIETVAENTSDGVVAPMIYMMLGGAPLGFFYKAINTMDSMIGYKNDKYMYFGTFAARLDDVVNYIPARISAWLMIISAAIMPGMSGKNGFRIYKRDRKKSPSPNSAQTESVCAGALRIRLLGDAVYFGKVHHKETIGDGEEPVTPEKIRAANKLMYATAVLGMVILAAVKVLLIYIILMRRV